MFDIGFLELLLIGTIGLLVLGPERLPVVARKVGMYLRKARQSWQSLKTEIETELHNNEIKQSVSDPLEQLKSGASEIEKSARDSLDSTSQDPPEKHDGPSS